MKPAGADPLDWLIIGGGIHGVHIAARLIGHAGVARERLRIVDPAPRLLARWRACAATTGMTHLRSPSVHHLDLDPWSLKHFAREYAGRDQGLFARPYRRPALALFNAHCDRVVETFSLAELHVEDRVGAVQVDADGVAARLRGGEDLRARRVVLAIGASEQLAWPEWAPRGHDRVRHIFEPGFEPQRSLPPERVAIVGGGVSAGQVALRLHTQGHEVHLVSRHPLRQHQFDSDPGWLGPKRMTRFRRERDFDRRRAMITEARYRGSVPPDVRRALRRAITRERLGWHQRRVEGLAARPDGLALRLSAGVVLHVDRVLLATGFAPERPGGAMVDALVESASLPCARCGYPIVDAALRWHPRVHVSGALAELELGPSSRNIAGARRAGERLVDVVRESEAGRAEPAAR